jgi:hypothetical protein
MSVCQRIVLLLIVGTGFVIGAGFAVISAAPPTPPSRATATTDAKPASDRATHNPSAPGQTKDDAGRSPWQCAVCLGGGMLAGVLLVLLLTRRDAGARRASNRAADAS